jgi:hypothetical protein
MRTIQTLLGHRSLETTMIYTHVARKGPAGVTSPLDALGDLSTAAIEAALRASRQLGPSWPADGPEFDEGEDEDDF